MGKFFAPKPAIDLAAQQRAQEAEAARVAEEKRKLQEEEERERKARIRGLRGRQSLFTQAALGFRSKLGG